jgi:hypothetical protein
MPGNLQAAMNATQDKAAADEAAKVATQAHADALADLGLNADGTVASLSAYTEALFAAGLSTMSAREAEAAHEAAIDNTKTAVEEATAALAKEYEAQGMGADAAKAQAEAQMGLGAALTKNKGDFDRTTAAGRILNEQFQSVAKTGMAEIEAKAKAGAGQPELQKNLVDTFNALKTTGEGMGLTGGAADTLARKVMGIPPKANINTWMSDEAKRMAEATDQAVRNLDGKTARTYVIHTTRNIIENVTTSSASVHNNTGGKQGTKPTFHAEGGAIRGPGTGTSDEVPAWLSNGEHVFTAAEVAKMGGQAAVYRFRQMVKAGKVPKFATGGAVRLGTVSTARWNQLLAQGWRGRAGDGADILYPPAPKPAPRPAPRPAPAPPLTGDRREFWLDYQRDSRRGNGYRSVTQSASNANSFADRLTTLADSGKVGAAAIRNLYDAAGRGEAGLRALHSRSDKLSASLDKAKDRLDDLQSTRASVGKKLSGEFSLSDAVKEASFYSKGSVKGIQQSANATLARLQKFAGKLNALQKRGYSAAVVQEVADMGSEEGTKAADILLAGTTAERNALNSTYVAIDKAADAAGIYVTNAMYKGGINAAAGLVKGLQSQEKAIEKQMLSIGLGMEKALKKALGIRSPSRKAMAIGANFTGTLTDTLKQGQASVAEQARALGDAMTVAPSKSLAGGYGQNLSIQGREWGTSAAVASAASGPVTNNWYITDQSNPVATAHEVARRQQSLEV